MLVIPDPVSILSIKSNIIHIHRHSHDEEKHEHYHTHMFGIIHGLASNDELLILFTASLGITSLAGLLMYVGIFSLGVIAGMVIFGLVMSYPLIKSSGASLNKLVTLTLGVISIIYGGIWIISPQFIA